MATLTPSQIYTLLLQSGFDQREARIMTAIAQAESARNPGAVGDVALQTSTWGPSVGLFQIRTLKSETGTGSDRDIERLMNNPAEQVKAARNIAGGGDNFRPWSTFKNGAYLKFLDEPLQAGVPVPSTSGTGVGPFGAGMGNGFGMGVGAGPYGAGVGVGPYGAGAAAFGAGANGADPFAMAPVPQPSGITDQDGDGLTDGFESAAGTLEPAAQIGVPGGAALAPGGFGGAGGLGAAGPLGTDPLAAGVPGTGTDELAAYDHDH